MNEQLMRVAIDFGSSTTRVMIACVGDEVPLEVLALGVSTYAPLRRGVIVDLAATKQALHEAITQAEEQAGLKINAASVAIGGPNILAVNSDSAINIRDKKISADDVLNVIMRARERAHDPHYKPLHVLPQRYIVDEHQGITDPVGMAADSIEARVHIISAAQRYVDNIVDCVNALGIDIIDLVFAGMAVSQVALSEEERDLGVCVVDIGAGTMDYMVWQHNEPLHAGVIDVGAELVSSDLAMVLKTPRAFAEELKCQFGGVSRAVIEKQQLEVASTGLRPNRLIPKDEVVDIIVNRYSEMFEMLLKDWKRAGINIATIGEVVLTGGGAQIAGLTQLVEELFNVPISIAYPEEIHGLPDFAQRDPSLYTLLGLIKLQHQPYRDYVMEKQEKEGIIRQFKNLIQRYL